MTRMTSTGKASASPVARLAAELIRCPSVAPADAGAQARMAPRLAALGFAVHPIMVDGVRSFWALRGTDGPVFAFAGHSDVVPPGDEAQWTAPPFTPEIRDGRLYGRGAADMKGPLAAVIVALERFLAACPAPPFRLLVLIAGDEEPEHNHGTRDLLERLRREGLAPDCCLVPEPVSRTQLGDTLLVGRRGSMHGHLTVRGVQGHSAHPGSARNPIAEALPVLLELSRTQWDEGTDAFPPTSFQWTNLHSGVGAANVTPGVLEAQFNLRFSDAPGEAALRERIEAVLRGRLTDWELRWSCDARPFLSRRGWLTETVSRVVETIAGRKPVPATDGGTSDARFIAPTGAEVVEFGLVGATGHQVDESVSLAELETLTAIYQEILATLAADLTAGREPFAQ